MPRLRTLTIGLAATTMMSGALAIGGLSMAASAPAARHAPSAVPASGGVTVKTHHKGLGTYLVDSRGHALYRFEKDNHSTKSHCYKDCAKDWPPFITMGKPHAGGKVKGSLLGTTKRKNGDHQVTYGGHPLYFFADDRKSGQTHGEGIKEFGAEWNVVNKNGHEIKQGG